MEAIRVCFLSLKKDRDIVSGRTIPKSRPHVSITVVGENTKLFGV